MFFLWTPIVRLQKKKPTNKKKSFGNTGNTLSPRSRRTSTRVFSCVCEMYLMLCGFRRVTQKNNTKSVFSLYFSMHTTTYKHNSTCHNSSNLTAIFVALCWRGRVRRTLASNTIHTLPQTLIFFLVWLGSFFLLLFQLKNVHKGAVRVCQKQEGALCFLTKDTTLLRCQQIVHSRRVKQKILYSGIAIFILTKHVDDKKTDHKCAHKYDYLCFWWKK